MLSSFLKKSFNFFYSIFWAYTFSIPNYQTSQHSYYSLHFYYSSTSYSFSLKQTNKLNAQIPQNSNKQKVHIQNTKIKWKSINMESIFHCPDHSACCSMIYARYFTEINQFSLFQKLSIENSLLIRDGILGALSSLLGPWKDPSRLWN